MAGQALALLALTFLVLAVDLGHGQTINCFADETFGCSGAPGGQRTTGQQCCDEGFLAFAVSGSEDCTICSGNSICHASSNCSDVFPGLGTQTPGSCCGTGGSAYVGSSGICQACPSSIDSCFTGSDCSGDTVPLTSTGSAAQIRECCLSDNGQSYDVLGQCTVCIVYGFLQTRIMESERGQGYPFEVGYVKGTGRVFRGRIEEVPGGTATMGADYSISPTIFTGRPGNPAEIIATFRVDNIAQEINETAQLKISVTLGSFPPEAIFIDTIEFVIVDSDEVRVQLTENDYRSNEDVERIPVVVSKNVRLANPITFLLTPFNESEAIRTGQPLPANLPLDDNPLSPNRAKSYPPDSEDFSSDVIMVTFEADETGIQINDMAAPVNISDDELNEALEEVFIVVLTLESSTDPGSVIITRVSSLCRIIDNDDIVIGFQNASYTFSEPLFETEIFGVVFLEKENGRISEQEFRVVIEVSTATPNANIRPATLTSRDANKTIINNDYLLLDPDQTSIVSSFLPTAQTLEFVFTLFPDEIAEGTEAFQARSSPSEGGDDPDYTIPTSLNTLFAETFIIIEDDDPVILGLEQNFTVPEDVGSFEACFRIFNPPDDQELTFSIDLVIDTIVGTAGNVDFTPIRSSTLDVFETLEQDNRRACFDVTINNDQVFENSETFSLLLSFDEQVLDSVRNIVTIEPSVVYVTIEDTTDLTIGFINSPYTGNETDPSIQFQVGVIGSTTLEREVVVEYNTADGTGAGTAAIAGSDYTAVSGLQLAFNAATRSIPVDVSLLVDDVFELTESFSGLLSLPGGPIDRLTLDPDSALAEIIDDDVLSVGYNPDLYSFGESSGSGEISAALSGDPGVFTVFASYQTNDGTAIVGADYAFASGSLSFTSSQVTATYSVDILPDELTEGLESFGVSLSDIGISLDGVTRTLSDQEAGRLSLQPATAIVSIDDDDPATIGFVQTGYVVSEDGGPVEFLVGVLDGDLAIPVEVSFATADGTALVTSDYNQTSAILTFTGTGQQSVFVDLVDDDIFEGSENFEGLLTEGANFPDFVTLEPAEANAEITDDDLITIGFDPDVYNVNEDDGTVTFTVSVLDGTIADDASVLVNFFTSQGSALAGIDYTETTMNLTFTSVDTSFQISVGITPDELFENLESFTGNIQIADGVERVLLLPDVATVNIADADEVTIGFRPIDYSVLEANTTIDLTVMVIDGSLGRDVQIAFNTAEIPGQATANGDYVAIVNQILSFSSDVSTVTIPVMILDDFAVEPEFETFNGVLTDPNIDRLTVDPDTAVVTIQDNDNASIGFDRLEYDVIENATFANITIRLTGMISKEIVVLVSTADGSAVSVGPEADFMAHSMEYTFTPGGPSEIIIPIRIIDDLRLEPDEDLSSIISLTTVSDVINLDPAEATIRIIDDDDVVIGFTQTEYLVTEGVGVEAPLVVSVLMGTLRRSVVVNVNTQDGSAVDGSDYTERVVTLTFDQDTTSIPFPVEILNDEINEVVESFTASLQSDDDDVILSPISTTVQITDDDPVLISFREPIYMFNEGIGTATVCIDKVGQTTQTISVMVSGPLQAETGLNINQVVVFLPEEFEQCITFEVMDDDIALEESETFTWELTLISTPVGVVLGDNPTTDIVILDDDPLTISLEKQTNIPENITNAQACITFSNPFAREFEINRATQMPPNTTVPAIAEPDVDFTSLSGSLTATPADGDAGQLCFNISIEPDEIVEEPSECFGVSIELPEDERENIMLEQGSAICCIIDDDTVTIGFDPIIYNVDESAGPVELVVRIISGELARPVEVILSTEDATATSTAPVDYINPGDITLQFDSVTDTQFARITIMDDDIYEDQEFFISNLISFDGSVIINPGRAEVVINEDNDEPTIGFVPDSYRVNEDDGMVTLNVEVIRGTLERRVFVVFTTESGTATSDDPADFEDTTVSLTFTPTVSTVSFPVNITNDDIVEGTESFTGNLDTTDGAILNPDVAVIEITDSETPPDTVVIGLESNYTIVEGDSTQVCAVLLQGTLERDAVVTLTTVAGTASADDDYEPISVQLTFNAGTSRACADLNTVVDILVEGSEFLTLELSTDDSSVVLDPRTSSVEIEDDDMIVIGLTETEISVGEEEKVVEVCAEVISGELERSVMFTLTSADGTAIAGNDYDALSAIDLEFTSSIREVCVNVTIMVDDIYENDETFTVTVSTDDTQVVVEPDRETGTVTIVDEDGITIGFEQIRYSVQEILPSVEVCARILSGNLALERDAIVDFFTADGTEVVENDAVAPDDYQETIRELVFNADNDRLCVDIPIESDDAVEGVEVFWANLRTDAPRVILDPAVAGIDIIDEDVAIIGYVETPYEFPEEGEIATVVLAVFGDLQEDVLVNLRSEDISGIDNAALAGVDYTPIDVNLTFSADVRNQSVNVMLFNDGFDELDELFNARITILSSEARVEIQNGMPLESVTIVDEDGITIGFEVTSQDITEVEGVGTREVCAVITGGTLMRTAIVNLVHSEGTALVVEDFEAVAAVLEFDADTNRACATITIEDDTRHETTEEVFELILTTDDPDITLDPSTTTFTIVDDDDVVIGWELTEYTVTEEVDQTVELCAVITGELTFELPPITISTRDGTATSSASAGVLQDYISVSSPSSFVFSDSSARRMCTTIPISDNQVLEETIENFFVDLMLTSAVDRVSIDPVTAEVSILDNDPATIGFIQTAYTFDEDVGDGRLIIGVLDGTLETDILVQITTSDGSAVSTANGDYTGVINTLTFSGSSSERTQAVAIEDDSIDEQDLEDFFANLVLVTVNDRVTIAPADATVYIRDNDVVMIGFERETYITTENNTITTEVCAIVTEDSPTLDREVEVQITSSDGSAEAPDDYESVSETFTFGPGNTRQCVSITVQEDDVVEGEEEFTLTLNSTDDVELIPDTATVIIDEVEFVRVMFREPEYTFTENGIVGSVEVIKDRASDSPFDVRVVGGPSLQTDIERSADGIDEVQTFEAGPSAVNLLVFEFALTDDSVGLEAIERYFADLTIVGTPDGVMLGALTRTTVNVLDDDIVSVSFGTPQVTVEESDEFFMMCVVLNREALQDVVVQLESVDGTAVADDDYIASSIPSSVTISAGDSRTCFNGTIVNDEAQEDTESFTLNIVGTGPDGVVVDQGTTEIVIEDGDHAMVRFEQPTYTFNEDVGTGEICLIKNRMTVGPVTVPVTTQEGTANDPADYMGGPFSVTFSSAAGDRQCITITLVSDSVSENQETFTATIDLESTGDVRPGVPAVTVVTILDTGIQVNDTAIGDPLMTVPLLVNDDDLEVLNTTEVSLCYEIHGAADQFFNLVTDECASVNARYHDITSYLNVINQIGVRATDDENECKNILVDVDGCRASVNGMELNGQMYSSNGISVRSYANRVRISVPNCNELSLIMWVFCETRTLDDPDAPGGSITGEMIKFVVMRGLNFGHRQAHGLIGQFWNIRADIKPFTGLDVNGDPQPNRYVITIPYSTNRTALRSFTGWYYPLTWSFEEGPCLYVGNRQAGPIQEVDDPNDAVIEGRILGENESRHYKDYRVQSAFDEEEYVFGLFREDRCVAGSGEPMY